MRKQYKAVDPLREAQKTPRTAREAFGTPFYAEHKDNFKRAILFVLVIALIAILFIRG